MAPDIRGIKYFEFTETLLKNMDNAEKWIKYKSQNTTFCQQFVQNIVTKCTYGIAYTDINFEQKHTVQSFGKANIKTIFLALTEAVKKKTTDFYFNSVYNYYYKKVDKTTYFCRKPKNKVFKLFLDIAEKYRKPNPKNAEKRSNDLGFTVEKREEEEKNTRKDV